LSLAFSAVVADYNWGFRGSGRGRPRGEIGAGDGADRRNMSEMVTFSFVLKCSAFVFPHCYLFVIKRAKLFLQSALFAN